LKETAEAWQLWDNVFETERKEMELHALYFPTTSLPLHLHTRSD